MTGLAQEDIRAASGLLNGAGASLAAQGADLRDKHLKKAMADLGKLEDAMFEALKTASDSAATPLAGSWSQVLGKMQAGGLPSGEQATAAVKQVVELAEQLHGGHKALRESSLRAAHALTENYTAMVSGVLLGMGEAMQSAAGVKKPDK
ncbi:MAG: DUF6781 family protein [Burkholderiaceae bacterium]